jgi:hypothetical protein
VDGEVTDTIGGVVEDGGNIMHKHITNWMYYVLLVTVYYINYI